MSRTILSNGDALLRLQIKVLINLIQTVEIHDSPCAIMAVQLNDLKVIAKRLHTTTCKLSASLKKDGYDVPDWE